jgi:polyhydroxybutyrate depolymerase
MGSSASRLVLGLLVLAGALFARASDGLERREWIVDGVKREALVHIPAGATGALPLVFAFHGHGGSMAQAAHSFPIHELWPGAMVVYPQGLPSVSKLVDPKGEMAGWQREAGTDSDRDLKFFDAMLAGLRAQYRVDDKRIYATGHSNGGAFTYQLWAERGKTFAAFAPSAALLTRGFGKMTPKPVLHIGSPQDTLVKFSWQARMIDQVLKLNGCGPREGERIGYSSYPSSKGAEVATYLHDNGHKYPGTAATELIVKFFQTHTKP